MKRRTKMMGRSRILILFMFILVCLTNIEAHIAISPQTASDTKGGLVVNDGYGYYVAPAVSPFGDEILAVKIQSKFLNEERTIHIHLPPEYHKTRDKFPVLVLLDGEWSFRKFKPVVKSLIQEGKIPGLIIAGIENISEETRLRDFTPTAVSKYPGSGQAARFLRFFEEEFLPFMDKNYRTSPVRIIYGHSLAGLMSAQLFLTLPHAFSGCIASSPSFSWDDELMVRSVDMHFKKEGFQNKFLYLAIGSKDFPTYMKAMDHYIPLLKENAPSGLKWEYKIYEDEDHTTMPNKSFPDGLTHFFSFHRNKKQDFLVLQGPYLGQKPPGMTPEIFAPGIISIDGYEDLCSGFMDGGKVFIFSRLSPDEDWKKKSTYWLVMKGGVWSKPVEVPFNDLHPYNFSVAEDGDTLYFTTVWSEEKPRKLLKEEDLWKVKYSNGVWDEPKKLGPEINTDEYYENYPTVAQNGTIYYMKQDPNGYGKVDLVYYKLVDNKYGKMMNVGAPVNTQLNELDPFVAPDESYLIFLANYKDSRGSWDLYISYKKYDGKWTDPINMGDDINTRAWESRPYVTIDGKYLFFSRGEENPSWADIFWVDAKIIEDLKPVELK